MTGEQLKAEGQAKSLKRAGSAWLEDTLFWLDLWIKNHRKAEINFDEFRSSGLADAPASVNAWGSLPRAAVKRGLIAPTDRVVKAQRPTARVRTVKVWKVLVTH